jgi:hypothetical protein
VCAPAATFHVRGSSDLPPTSAMWAPHPARGAHIADLAEDHECMARGDHPMRTPVYGALLIAAAMIGATLVVYDGGAMPGWLHAALLILAIPVALVGWLMTFRDLSPPRRRRR